jgi:HEPN domain-containing protein
MKLDKPGLERLKAYWLSEAIDALTVANHLVEKKDYSYALFFGHLAVEKILKALYVLQKGDHAPLIHNLVRLALDLELDLDETKKEALITITGFNIEARYPDIKRSFRDKCTIEYTTKQMKIIKEIFEWLQSCLT